MAKQLHVKLIADRHLWRIREKLEEAEKDWKKYEHRLDLSFAAAGSFMRKYELEEMLKNQLDALDYRRSTMRREKCDAVLVELAPSDLENILKNKGKDRKMLESIPEIEIALKRGIPVIPIEDEKLRQETGGLAHAKEMLRVFGKMPNIVIDEESKERLEEKYAKANEAREANHAEKIISLGKEFAAKKDKPVRFRVILGSSHTGNVSDQLKKRLGKEGKVKTKTEKYQIRAGKFTLSAIRRKRRVKK